MTMPSAKATIVGLLGEGDLFLPDLVHGALAANARVKYFLTLLQLARAHADSVDGSVPDLRRERELAGVVDERLDDVIRGSQRGRDSEYRIPLVRTILQHVFTDIEAMIAPVRAAGPSRFDAAAAAAFERRRAALASACVPDADSEVTREALGRATSSDRDRGDSVHLLVFDLHKAVDAVAASFATDDVDGAKTFGLAPEDRPLVRAFMKGVHATEAVKFGHSGLGTMATRRGPVLILENDIGETTAHVLVVHVEGLRVVVTSTDVHVQRLDFFRRMLDGFRIEWADVRSRAAREIQEAGLFYECVGTLDARDRQEREGFLTHLGSRLVFLIDWNRARKALRSFVSKSATLELLAWAAREGHGHRGFLEMGGERLVFDAMAAIIRTPLRYGERLDDVLGPPAATELLRSVLRESSVGLRNGRSPSLVRAAIRTELAKALRGAGERLLGPVVDHAGILAEIARGVRAQLEAVTLARAIDQEARARVARDHEHRGDECVVFLRGIALRAPEAEAYLRVVERADDAADALEEAAFLLSLLPPELPDAFRTAPFGALGEIVAAATEAYLAAVTSARGARPDDTQRSLDALDTVTSLEHRMDEAERRLVAALARQGAVDGKLFVIASRISGALERAVDALMHASLLVRDRFALPR